MIYPISDIDHTPTDLIGFEGVTAMARHADGPKRQLALTTIRFLQLNHQDLTTRRAEALGGRTPFPIETMLHIHCLQLWWNPSDPAVEEELHERPLYRRFAGLEGAARMPDETTILRFRHLLGKHQLAPPGAGHHQCRPCPARPDAQDRHGGGRHHHCRAEWATSGTSA